MFHTQFDRESPYPRSTPVSVDGWMEVGTSDLAPAAAAWRRLARARPVTRGVAHATVQPRASECSILEQFVLAALRAVEEWNRRERECACYKTAARSAGARSAGAQSAGAQSAGGIRKSVVVCAPKGGLRPSAASRRSTSTSRSSANRACCSSVQADEPCGGTPNKERSAAIPFRWAPPYHGYYPEINSGIYSCSVCVVYSISWHAHAAGMRMGAEWIADTVRI